MAKYGNGVATNDIVEAISLLKERNMSKMSTEGAITPNVRASFDCLLPGRFRSALRLVNPKTNLGAFLI